MRRIWLLVILLGIVTAVVLAYTWQNIPYLNTFLIDNGVISAISGVTSGLGDVLNGNMPLTQVIPIMTGAGTVGFAVLRQVIENARRTKADAKLKLNDMQSTVGSVKLMAQNTVDTVTGAKDQLQGEYDELQTQKTDLEATLTMKDKAIIDVQSEIMKVQNELKAKQNELLETTKQMDEYRIALEQKALPTTH